ncbi:hypothetical protein CCACVL1_29619, partial [Corchorus capsularis]
MEMVVRHESIPDILQEIAKEDEKEKRHLLMIFLKSE